MWEEEEGKKKKKKKDARSFALNPSTSSNAPFASSFHPSLLVSNASLSTSCSANPFFVPSKSPFVLSSSSLTPPNSSTTRLSFSSLVLNNRKFCSNWSRVV